VSGKVIIHVEIICSQEKKDNVRVWLGASLLLLLRCWCCCAAARL
jgi:hypothetical protein